MSSVLPKIGLFRHDSKFGNIKVVDIKIIESHGLGETEGEQEELQEGFAPCKPVSLQI